MAGNTAPAVPPWTITGQREAFDRGPDGNFVSGVVVSFLTDAGDAGTVFVPKSSYSIPAVSALVDDYAQRLRQVRGLTGAPS